MKPIKMTIFSFLGILSLYTVDPLHAGGRDPCNRSQYNGHTSANYTEEDRLGYSTFAEYLFWQSDLLVEDTNALTRGEAEQYRFKSKCTSGIRLGVQKTLEKTDWDIGLIYTWLQPNKSVSHHEDHPCTYKQSFWHLDLNVGKNLFAEHYFSIKPHVGLKLLETKYQQTGDYTQKTTFSGIGISTGLSPTFSFTPSLSLYSNFTFSLPYGSAKSSASGTSDEKMHMITQMIEGSIGLCYHLNLGEDNDYGLSFQLGWEENFILNHFNPNNDFLVPTLDTQGLVLRASFAF